MRRKPNLLTWLRGWSATSIQMLVLSSNTEPLYPDPVGPVQVFLVPGNTTSLSQAAKSGGWKHMDAMKWDIQVTELTRDLWAYSTWGR